MVSLFKPKYTVEQIHNEIDTAEDRIIAQADALLNSLNITTETKLERKAEKLKELGFTSSKPVKQLEALQKRNKEISQPVYASNKQAKKLKEYKMKYPLQKFLTIAEMERICKKYKLVMAPAKNYINDIPEANVLEMVAATPLVEKVGVRHFLTMKSFRGNPHETVKPLIGQRLDFFKWRGSGRPDTSDILTELRIRYNVSSHADHWNGEFDLQHFDWEEVDQGGIFIAAPSSHFDLKGLKANGKFGFLSSVLTSHTVPLDPIAFEHCQGDMVRVLTKWGTPDDQAFI